MGCINKAYICTNGNVHSSKTVNSYQLVKECTQLYPVTIR